MSDYSINTVGNFYGDNNLSSLPYLNGLGSQDFYGNTGDVTPLTGPPLGYLSNFGNGTGYMEIMPLGAFFSQTGIADPSLQVPGSFFSEHREAQNPGNYDLFSGTSFDPSAYAQSHDPSNNLFVGSFLSSPYDSIFRTGNNVSGHGPITRFTPRHRTADDYGPIPSPRGIPGLDD